MPELPEVETIKRILEKSLVGKKIVDIEVRKAKIFKGETKNVIGKTIKEIERRGKVLIVKLSGNKALLVHLKLTGQLVFGEPGKTTHVIFKIDNKKLLYNDLRQFGWIKVVSGSKYQVLSMIGKLGVEPFSKEFTTNHLKQIFSQTGRPVKLVLMDQERIAGIGNIYANEILFEAGILPAKQANKLTNDEVNRVYRAMIKVLKEGIKYGGSSAKDESYIKPTGESGSYQKHFRVYQRAGQKCLKCGGLVKRINLAGRGTFYCPSCQK